MLRLLQLPEPGRGQLAEVLGGHRRGQSPPESVRNAWSAGVRSPPTEPCLASPWPRSSPLPQKNLTCVMEEVFTNLQSPEGENYCMSNNKHLNST